MNIILDDGTIKENICNIKKIDYVKSWSKTNKIYMTNINGELFILKSKIRDTDIEHNIIKKINEYSNKSYTVFFEKVRKIEKCGRFNLYLINYIYYDELVHLIGFYNKSVRKNILLQCLFGIYILNHKFGYYHNDLYHGKNVRNIMLDRLDKPEIIKVDNMELSLGKYIIKIIDLEFCHKEPKFRTTEYHNKYFKDIKYISEILLFTYFYYTTLGKDKHDKLLNKAKKIEEQSSSRIEFDRHLINYVINAK